MSPAIPEWCSTRVGGGAVLFVAPHGGRRPAVDASTPPPRLRVNDIYTPEVTALLAQQLDASAIINRGQDRNTLDLNRISQVCRHAPWFLDLLVERIEAILAEHAQAEVVFIHGWNIGQPKCDIGIGAIEKGAGLHVPEGAELTVSREYVGDRLTALRHACTARGIAAPVGEHYPATHRNNLLQAFTAKADIAHPAASRLREWSRSGRLQALQLELGIPLRWPGIWRERFVEAVVQAFFRATASGAIGERTVPTPTPLPSDSGGGALQFYDAIAGIGAFAGVGRMSAHSTAGRLLLFLGGQRVALFTGEERSAGGTRVGGLELLHADGATQLRFRGSMLLLDDAATYVDLEAALAASRLIEAHVDLSFTPCDPAALGQMSFGAVSGQVVVDGTRRAIHAGAFANAGILRAGGALRQTMVAADLGAAGGLLARVTSDGTQFLARRFAGAQVHSFDRAQVVVTPDGDPFSVRHIELHCDDDPRLAVEPLSRMIILRPAGPARYLRVTFGVGRCTWGEHRGHALYEHAEPVAAVERAGRATLAMVARP